MSSSRRPTTPSRPTRPVSVIFELLRQRDGSFVFEADDTTPEAGAPSDVDTLIREAEHLLIEWQEIEAVVPSIDVWVSMSAELPRPEVVVDEARWKVIVATGAGATVAEVGDRLGLGEIGISKAVKEVVEIGLLTISDAPANRTMAPVPEAAPHREPGDGGAPNRGAGADLRRARPDPLLRAPRLLRARPLRPSPSGRS